MIDDRLANELERIGVEGRAIILAMFAPSSRVASPQGAGIIGIARRNRPAVDRNTGPGSSWICMAVSNVSRRSGRETGRGASAVWDSTTRPTPAAGHNTFAGRRLLFGRFSAEGAFAGDWLPAGRVRRQGGVGLQRQHHGNLLTRFEVGGA